MLNHHVRTTLSEAVNVFGVQVGLNTQGQHLSLPCTTSTLIALLGNEYFINLFRWVGFYKWR